MRLMKAFSLMVLLAIPVQAQQRVFVSIHGDDTNNCNALSPCRTFNRALQVVTTGGEVLAIDSGGFGPMFITASVSVIAPPGVEGSITQTIGGADAIAIDALGITVILRGLSVFGLGTAHDGIRVFDVGSLIVDSCNFTGFAFSGIEFSPTNATGSMSVNNSGFYQNAGNGIVTFGASPNYANFQIVRSRIEGNAFGLDLFQGSRGVIDESTSINNQFAAIFVQTQASGQSALLYVDSCVLAGNTTGIRASSNGNTGVETVRVSRSIITQNSFGLFVNDANSHLWSRGDNSVIDNTTPGAFTDFFTAY